MGGFTGLYRCPDVAAEWIASITIFLPVAAPGDMATPKEHACWNNGAGRGTMIAVTPAIANAIYVAVGALLTGMPATPEKILDTLKRKAKPAAVPDPARQFQDGESPAPDTHWYCC